MVQGARHRQRRRPAPSGKTAPRARERRADRGELGAADLVRADTTARASTCSRRRATSRCRVADALNASVTLEEQSRLGKRPTSSVAAYELFIRSRTPPAKTSEERLSCRLICCDRRLLSIPGSRGVSRNRQPQYFQAAYGDLSAFARGIEAAKRRLDIDPQLAPAHRRLA